MPMEANDALSQFKEDGTSEEVSSFKKNPILNLEAAVGSFVTGTLINRREVTTQFGKKKVYNVKVESYKSNATIKGNSVEVKSEEVVSIFAKTDLDRKLNLVNDGSSVYIEYTGRDKKRKNSPHVYRVLAKKGSEAVPEVSF